MILRDYQLTALADLRAAFRDYKRAPLLVCPTGSGKTVIFAEICRASVERGKRVLVLVHRAELLRQASAKLTAAGVDHGYIISGMSTDYDQRVQIASVPTLLRRLDQIEAPDLIVCDEAHHATCAQWGRIFAQWPDAWRLGVTATPIRLDGRGLGGIFDSLVMGPTVAALQDAGHLARARYYAPAQINLEGVRTMAGDYDRGQIEDRARAITGDVVAHYQRLAPGRQALAFCASCEHSRSVRDAFRAAGIAAEHLDGDAASVLRRRTMEDFAHGQVRIITSCDLFGEGLDIPGIEAAILLRPTQSLGLHLQQIGRALRPAPGKAEAIILDHAGNCLRHGFAETAREWSMDATSRRKAAGDTLPAASRCPVCFAVWAGVGRDCPQCGAVRPLTPREVRAEKGALAELDRARVDAMMAEQRAERKGAQTIDELVAIGKQRGYANPQFWARKVLAGRKNGKG